MLKFTKSLNTLSKYLPFHIQIQIHSKSRLQFLKHYSKHIVKAPVICTNNPVKLWGIVFRQPLLNAAGMFKNGEGYDSSYKQGSGGYLLGTTTHNPREGNTKNKVYLPCVMLPDSKSAINFLGLPNQGDERIIRSIKEYPIFDDFPLGVSTMRSPDYEIQDGLKHIVHSLHQYNALPIIKFIEINESCPNVKSGDNSQILIRLQFISENFIMSRDIFKPVIVKLSNDISIDALPEILESIVALGFSGLNFGNTATNYSEYVGKLTKQDREMITYFTDKFGGGLSGDPLWDKSLALIKASAQILDKIKPKQEFHLIQCGGINNAARIRESLQAGASLCQWYTGYFEDLAIHGDNLYQNIASELTKY